MRMRWVRKQCNKGRRGTCCHFITYMVTSELTLHGSAVQSELTWAPPPTPHHTKPHIYHVMSNKEARRKLTEDGPRTGLFFDSFWFPLLSFPLLCFPPCISFSFFLSLRICSKVVHSRQILSISRISTPGISRSKFLYFPSLILSSLLVPCSRCAIQCNLSISTSKHVQHITQSSLHSSCSFVNKSV